MILDDELFLLDEIVGADEFGCNAASFITELRSLSHRKEVTIYINSPGGNLLQSISMFEALERAKAAGQKITVIVDVALSAASVVAVGGGKVLTSPAGIWMLHGPASPAPGGNLDDLRRMTAALEKLTKTLVEIFAKKTGKPKTTVREWIDLESWFDCRESVAAGLADGIFTGARPRVAACANLGRFTPPARIRAAIAQQQRVEEPAGVYEAQLRDKLDGFKMQAIRERLTTNDVALHEAGHAALVLEFGGRLSSVEAGPTGGVTRFSGVSPGGRIAVTLAGVRASNEPRGLASNWADCDRQDILNDLRPQYPNASNEQLLTFACETSDEVVDSCLRLRGRFVVALAALLVERGRVSGRECHDLWDSFSYRQ